MADDTPTLSPGAAALLAKSKAKVQPESDQPVPAQTQQPTDQMSPGAAKLLTRSKVGAPSPAAAAPAASDNLPAEFGQGLTEGAAGLIGLPGAIGKGINWLAGGSPKPEDDQSFWSLHGKAQLPIPADILSKVPWYNSDQPNSLTGQIVRGAGSATATLPLGEFAGLGRAANAAYTYGPSLAGDLLKHYTGWNPAWAALPTALTMSGAERELSELMTKWSASRAAAAAKTAQRDFRQEKLDLPPQYKEQTAASQEAAAQQKEMNIADLQKRHDSEYTGADTDREAVAAGLGQSPTIEKAGEALQDAARSWKKTEFPQKLKDAEHNMYYNPDGSVAIPQDALGDLSNFNSSLKNSFYKAGELEPAAQKLRSRMPERLEDALDQIAKNQGLPPGSVPKATLDDMKKLRSILGDAMTSPKLTEGVDAGKMNELYRALSGDMEGAINNAAGPAGVARFKQFNEEAKRLYGLASGPVSDLISTVDKGAETISPNEAISKLGLTDGSKLSRLRSEDTLGKGLDEVAAAKLRMRPDGRGADPGDPDQFFSNLTPEAKTALFGDEKAGKIQDSIDRRNEADKALEKWTAEMGKREKKENIQSGIDLAKQKAEVSKKGARLSEAKEDTAATERELKYKPQSDSSQIPPWLVKLLAGVGAGYKAHELMGTAAQLPEWGTNALTLGIGGAGYLGARGLQEMIKNPASLRNMAIGGAAVTPFNRGPGGTP